MKYFQTLPQACFDAKLLECVLLLGGWWSRLRQPQGSYQYCLLVRYPPSGPQPEGGSSAFGARANGAFFVGPTASTVGGQKAKRNGTTYSLEF